MKLLSRQNQILIFLLFALLAIGFVVIQLYTQLQKDEKTNNSEFLRPEASNSEYFPFKSYRFEPVYTGNLVTEPIAIYDKNGSIILTALVSIETIFLDNSGKKQTILIPWFIEAHGERNITTWDDEPDITKEQSIEIVNRFVAKGGQISTIIGTDLKTFYAQAGPNGWASEEIGKFFKSYNSDIESFLKTGNPGSLEMILPIMISLEPNNYRDLETFQVVPNTQGTDTSELIDEAKATSNSAGPQINPPLQTQDPL